MNRAKFLALLIVICLPLSVQAAGKGYTSAGGAPADRHFHPKGKPPSKHTLEVLKQAKAALPFSDKRDFEEEKKGFIAAPDFWQVKGESGNIVWDMERYKFFLEGIAFASIHHCSASPP